VTVDEGTLSGYVAVHGRPPAFEGVDGRAYSVGVFSDDDPGPDGRYGASLIFIRWSASQEPDGHLETEHLARAVDPAVAEAEVGRMALEAVKAALDELIAGRPA
jgi:hypothetical protein